MKHSGRSATGEVTHDNDEPAPGRDSLLMGEDLPDLGMVEAG